MDGRVSGETYALFTTRALLREVKVRKERRIDFIFGDFIFQNPVSIRSTRFVYFRYLRVSWLSAYIRIARGS